MKIINQSSNNECGICSINMIINYYYHSDKDRKNQIYSYTKNMDKNGISILEIENILEKFKIQTQSYECEFIELFNITKPFIMILKNDNIFHYVVAIVKNGKLKIYDPIGNIKIINKNELINNFSGYIICTNYLKYKVKPINLKLNIFKNISILMNLIFIFINIFEFIFSILISFILSKLINIDLNQTFGDTIWKITFIYIVILLISELFNYLNKIIKNYYFCLVFPKSIDLFWKRINTKTNSFFNMFNEYELSQIYMYTYKCIHFISFCTSDIFSDTFIFVLAFAFGVLINHNNLYFYILMILINLFLMYINTKFDKNLINFVHKKNPNHEKKMMKYFANKINNHYYKNDIKFAKSIQIELNNTLFKSINIQSNISFLLCVDKIINALIQFVMIILIIKNENNFSLIFLNINLANLFNQTLKSILNFIKEYWSVNLILDIVKKVYSINSQLNSNCFDLQKINSITFSTFQYKKNLCINIQNLVFHNYIKDILDFNDTNQNIRINNLEINKINKLNFINNKLIFINPKNYNIDLSNVHLSNDIYEYCSKNCLDFSREIHLILILNLLGNEKDKLIIINDDFNDINDVFFVSEIKNKLREINNNNFLINNCCNKNIIDIYDNFI